MSNIKTVTVTITLTDEKGLEHEQVFRMHPENFWIEQTRRPYMDHFGMEHPGLAEQTVLHINGRCLEAGIPHVVAPDRLTQDEEEVLKALFTEEELKGTPVPLPVVVDHSLEKTMVATKIDESRAAWRKRVQEEELMALAHGIGPYQVQNESVEHHSLKSFFKARDKAAEKGLSVMMCDDPRSRCIAFSIEESDGTLTEHYIKLTTYMMTKHEVSDERYKELFDAKGRERVLSFEPSGGGFVQWAETDKHDGAEDLLQYEQLCLALTPVLPEEKPEALYYPRPAKT